MTGPLIIEKAKELAAELGIENFTGSAGWLQKFKKRHKIEQYTLHGEAAAADAEGISFARDKLPDFIEEQVSPSKSLLYA